MFFTKQLRKENPRLLTCSAKVLDVIDENGKNGQKQTVIILDQTVFQPQKSEQDPVSGLIESERGRFHVQRVEQQENYIHHVGTFEDGQFEVDEEVTCTMDEEFRKELEENKAD